MKSRHVAFVGSRDYPLTKTKADELRGTDLTAFAEAMKRGRELVERYVDRVAADHLAVIVSGGARGPDTWAVEHAKTLGLRTIEMLPNRKKYGRGAYHKRNTDIVLASDEVFAFWDLFSKGTDDTVAKAFKYRRPLIVFGPEGNAVFGADEADYETLAELHQGRIPKMDIPRGP
jgi:hypothetical protein